MIKDKARILVVDDCEDVRFLVSSLLRSMGHETVEAADGMEALIALERDPQIPLVITDLEMPRMDGLELTRRIRLDPRFEDLPVLMYSASPFEIAEARAKEAGATKLLSKTVNPGALRDEVDRILQSNSPDHVWRALLVGLSTGTAAAIGAALSEAGFQVLRVANETQAKELLLNTVDRVDLAFVRRRLPDSQRFVLVHRMRTEQDYNLFRLVMLIGDVFVEDPAHAGPVCVAGHLLEPVNQAQVAHLLRRLGLNAVGSRRGSERRDPS